MKKVLAIVVSVLLLVMMVPMGVVSVGAADGWSTSFLPLSGNGANDIVAVAQAQLEKTQSQLGYSSNWCAAFVSNCAKFAGQSEAIPYHASVATLYDKVVNAGGKIVSSPQKGDIAFYKSGSSFKHIAIVTKSDGTTIHGNVSWCTGTGRDDGVWHVCTRKPNVYENAMGQYHVYVRPNYNGNAPTPSSTIENGTYFIKNNSTGKYLDIKDGRDAQLQNVQVYAFNGSAAQSFEIKTSTTTTGYSMRPLLSTSRMVNVQADTVVNGKNVCLYDDTGHNSQRWQFEKVSGGYVIRNIQNPSCVLDVESNENVYVSTYLGKASQIWSLQNLVQYNANGGTGVPESQFKNHAETLKLSSTVPTREGYTFKGWATSQSATAAEYAAGADYTGNAAVTLYAVWQANTLKVSYDANGGTIAVDGYMLDGGLICNNDGTKYYQTWTYNTPKTNGLINRGTLGLARDGYSFMGWGTSPDGGVIFDPDNVDLLPTDITKEIKEGSCSVTLYAVWKCNHTYDNEYDADCNTCGAIREVPEKPPVTPDLPADAPAFVVESATAQAGKEVTVAIRTQRNSGVVSFAIDVAYDTAVLELIAAEEQDFAGVFFGPLTTAPFAINWVDAIHPDNTTDGVIALLTFRVKEGTPVGKTDIILFYDADNVFDQNYDSVAFRTEDGFVEVVDFAYGDVDGNGKINNRDLARLQQYITGWDVDIDLPAADVDGNGKINNRDLARLQQYITGWDVTLGK